MASVYDQTLYQIPVFRNTISSQDHPADNSWPGG